MRKCNWIVLVVVAVGLTGFYWQTPQPQDGERRLSDETTHIIEPLNKDGFVDYVQAVNDRLSRNIAPRENVVVKLIEVLDLENMLVYDESYRDAYMQQLGLEERPTAQSRYQSFYKFLERQTSDEQELNNKYKEYTNGKIDKSYSEPWSRDEYPLIAQWLDVNDPAIEVVKEAAKRPKFYNPLICAGDEPEVLVWCLLPLTQELRGSSRCLLARAMNRLKNGAVDACLADIVAVRQLASHNRHSLTLVEHLVSDAIDRMASICETAVIESGKASAQQLQRHREFLQSLPDNFDLAEAITYGERLMFLDLMQSVERYGPETITSMTDMASIIPEDDVGKAASEHMKRALYAGMGLMTDWTEAMHIGNQHFDRLGEAMNVRGAAEQLKALEAELDRLEGAKYRLEGSVGNILSLVTGPRSRGRFAGRLYFAMMAPAIDQVMLSSIRSRTQRQIMIEVLAMAQYQSERGDWPTAREQITPHYLKTLAEDPFSKGPLIFRRTDEWVRVYSLGRNQEDEQDLPYAEKESRGDDIFVEIKLPI